MALTHRSFAFEQRAPALHNERLEFLGDAVLGLVVTDLIYKSFENLAEGEMAKLRASVVNTRALAGLARSLGLGEHIRLGRGEETSGGKDKDSLLADTLEALIGAVYLDRGLPAAAELIGAIVAPTLEDVMATGGGYEAKTELQELVVRSTGKLPLYRVASSGPEHAKRFTARVYIDDELYGVGLGRSKKEAEQGAAREALVRLEPVLHPSATDPASDAPEDGGRGVRAC